MEMATVDPDLETTTLVAEDDAAAVNASQDKMFKHSVWLHVGEGALECQHVKENEKQQGLGCTNEEHFHSWCRLPNQFQMRDISEKATAAKARRIRILNDPESDANEVLESTLRSIRASDDKETVIEELLSYTWQEDYLQAITELEESEEYEHIGQDQEELKRLLELPEDERSEDEVERLERHVTGYVDATRAKVKEVQDPRRQALEGLSFDDLVDQLRQRRIEADSDEEFHHVRSTWEWFVGTRQPNKRSQKWERIADMQGDAPEVIDALRATFIELRTALQRGAQGN